MYVFFCSFFLEQKNLKSYFSLFFCLDTKEPKSQSLIKLMNEFYKAGPESKRDFSKRLTAPLPGSQIYGGNPPWSGG